MHCSLSSSPALRRLLPNPRFLQAYSVVMCAYRLIRTCFQIFTLSSVVRSARRSESETNVDPENFPAAVVSGLCLVFYIYAYVLCGDSLPVGGARAFMIIQSLRTAAAYISCDRSSMHALRISPLKHARVVAAPCTLGCYSPRCICSSHAHVRSHPSRYRGCSGIHLLRFAIRIP
ncbi:hypothetical protein SCHPADRAFT_283611 [Schizopora paradoxa]|uniref:Uncharacterized protein n=1 Tax=Schizopora paradoxa TaxID=27342 RepID=A0A0H2RZX7_9AGAM|nr:hypothetical protein SCHPADRAFT_283611 [Schizopora paradoxa]